MARDTISPNSPGLDTSFAQSRPSPLQPLRYVPVSALSSRFAFSLAAGGFIAALSDPFGSGSTFSTTGTVPAQLALSGNTIVKGAGTAVIGTEYGIDIVVTSPDGVAQPAVRLLFRAALPLGGTFTGGGVTPTPTPSALPLYPNFPRQTKLLRSLSDISNYNTDATRLAIVPEPDSIDGRNVISVKVNGTFNTTDLRFTLAAPWDVRNGIVRLWFKKISTEMLIKINMWSAGTAAAPTANYVTFGYDKSTFAEAYADNVYCEMGEHSSRFTVVGTGADLSAITHVQIQVGDASGNGFEGRISNFSFTPNQRTRAAVIFKVADAFADPYTVLRPMAAAKGLVVPYFLTPGAVISSNGYDRGGGSRLTTDQVNILRGEGTESGTQAWTTEAAQASYDAYVTEYTGMREYNRNKVPSWYADAADDSFHSGVNADSPNSRAAKIATGARTIQRFKNNATKNTLPPMLRPETFPFRDQMSHVCMNVAVLGSGTQTAVAQAMSHIDQAVAINGVAEFSIHGNVLNNQNTVDLFNAILDRKNNANDFDWATPKSLLDPFLAQYGPAAPYEFPYSMKQV